MDATTPPRLSTYRPDLEGLRAIAVVLVVVFHAGVTQLAGGYVGVDVFFVLSGYLITGLLVRELGSTDRISLAAFYARRVRRILPASLLVLAVTLVASAIVLAPVRLEPVAKDVAAAAAYVPNIRFAMQTTDYWHPGAVSPVLHFWSLGVEEQFYLLWPTLLLLAWRAGARSTVRLGLVVAAMTLASLVLGIALTPLDPTGAFYLLPTRAWELGVGALLALAEARLARLPGHIAGIVGGVGLGMVVAAALLFDSTTPFPGVAALVPVLGTALAVIAGMRGRRTWFLPALAARPMSFLGRISYSLYLWHWPLIVLGATSAAGVAAEIRVPVLVLLSVVAAAATYRWVEDPLRHGRLLGVRPSRNLAQALGGSVVMAVVALSVGAITIEQFSTPITAVAHTDEDPLAGMLPAASREPSAAATGDPVAGGDAAASGQATAATTVPAPAAIPLPGNLLPSLVKPLALGPAKATSEKHCGLNDPETVPNRCVDGVEDASTTVVLFGDSHALQWFPALEQVARTRGWRLVSMAKASCPYESTTVLTGDGARVFTECDEWRENALARIAEQRPALVIVSGNHLRIAADAVDDEARSRDLLLEGARTTIDRLHAMGAEVVVLGDTPMLPFDPIDCLSRHPDDITACSIPRSDLFDESWLAAEQATAEAAGAVFIDTRPWICPEDVCPLVRGRYLVFRDTNHIANPYMWALAGRLEEALPR